MRNLLKTCFKGLMALALAFSASAYAATPAAHERNEELDNLSFVEMLSSVDLGKNAELIRKFQDKEGKTRLLNNKNIPKEDWKVEFFRNKEVLLVTIPVSRLFAPNSTKLAPGAWEYLAPFRRYLRDSDMYRVLLVMHTDNTGSEAYRDKITMERAESVFNWFEDHGDDTRFLFDYAMGDDMPLNPNNSVDNRSGNRRLEVYLIPGKKMVEQAKKGRIVF